VRSAEAVGVEIVQRDADDPAARMKPELHRRNNPGNSCGRDRSPVAPTRTTIGDIADRPSKHSSPTCRPQPKSRSMISRENPLGAHRVSMASNSWVHAPEINSTGLGPMAGLAGSLIDAETIPCSSQKFPVAVE